MGVRPGAALTVALVTGATGQDGSYLTELLLGRGYDVVGVVRDPAGTAARERVELVSVDLLDVDGLASLLRAHGPREVYNLAAQTFVPQSWDDPVEATRVTGLGVTALLEAVRRVDDTIRVFQATSSEVFGRPTIVPQNEETPFAPLSPYGAAKCYGHFMVGVYRARYGLHASCGILYNHESPRRSDRFLPSKLAHAVAAIAAGRQSVVVLGDLDAQRDWGYAPDYVEAMWRMLQQDEPDDYVVATGELHSVAQLAEAAFAHAGLDWREHVQVDESLKRGQTELHQLVGDASKARERLGWSPSVTFDELVALLVDAA